jgi:hypothetical protein
MSANTMHAYEIRPRKDKRGFDMISDALPFHAYHKLYFAGCQRPASLVKMTLSYPVALRSKDVLK